MKLAAMAIGIKSNKVMKQYHHGRYSFKSWKKVTLIKIAARAKIRIAMNIIPHLIGRQPKQVASPTLSWEHAHMQQQHGLKVYISSAEIASDTDGSPPNPGILALVSDLAFSVLAASSAGAAAATGASSTGFCSVSDMVFVN
jgi:hypothetical protein|tara:strand:+ start:552 stop:977 length:426 start_codon:yes stop_codon:yes gene_type:complete